MSDLQEEERAHGIQRTARAEKHASAKRHAVGDGAGAGAGGAERGAGAGSSEKEEERGREDVLTGPQEAEEGLSRRFRPRSAIL